MGRSYLFECPKCGYQATVSGRTDRGFHFAVATILCRNCKELYDAVIRLKMPDDPARRLFPRLSKTSRPQRPPTFDAALNRLLIDESKGMRWEQFKISCPVSAVHQVELWTDPGRCPRCGVYLEKGALPFRLWE